MADVITRLRVESSEHDNKIKRASESLQSYANKCRQVGGTLEKLDEGVLEYVRDLGKMETVNKTARGSISELTKAFTDLRIQYNQLTLAEKQSPFGKALKSSLDELKVRIQAGKKELNDISQELSGSKFGQFGSIIDGIGRKMGVNANLTELLTSRTALLTAGLGATIASVTKGTEEWAKYNQELARQDEFTAVTTGLKGIEANDMTDKMRALTDTYKVNFNDSIQAANTLMTQFGISGSEAISLIKDGMQGMIRGDGQKLLSMIQQYAPSFRDAGVSASQLVAVIHNSEGGIFTDQNMNAIVMGIRNIRLMTKQTSDALDKLGIDGQEMARKMSDGSMSVFDALRQVAEKLEHCEAGSQTAGEVMQSVFGRQGTAAGTNLAKAIATLNTNLEQTKTQTGEVGKALADLQTANENLNASLRETFSYDGWDEMATGIKTQLINALADVIEKLGKIKGLLWGITPGQARKERYGTTGVPEEVKNDLKALQQADESERENVFNRIRNKYSKRVTAATNDMANWRHWQEVNEQSSNWQGVPFVRKALDRWQYSNGVRTATSRMEAEQQVMQLFLDKAAEIMNPSSTQVISKNLKPTNTTTSGHSNTTETTKAADAIAADLEGLPKLTEELKNLQHAQSQALNPNEWQRLQEEIDTTQLKISAFKGDWKENMQATFSVSVNDTEAYEKLKNLPNALVEEDVITVVANTAEAFKQCQDLFNTIEGYDVEFSIVPGQSELTFQNLNAIISDLKSKINTSGIGTTLYNTLTSRLADATAIGNLIRVAIQNGIDTSQLNLDSFWTEIINGEDIPDTQLQTIVDKINSYLTLHHIELNFDVGSVSDESNESDKGGDGKSDEKGSGNKKKRKNINTDDNGNEYGIIGVGKAASGFSSLISSVEQLGIELPEGLKNIFGGIQAVANILTSIMTIVQAIQIIQNSTSFLPFFANGGVVPHAAGGAYIPGNHYSGDVTPVFANAGELILNKASQANLASMLTNDGQEGSTGARPYVSGEQIYIGLSNYLRRTGRGEILTARG